MSQAGPAEPQPQAEGGPFTVPVTVRGYETDTQGHLNQAVYLQYAEHARWSLLQAAGIEQSALVASGVGPVVLEQTLRYKRELRAGDEVTVSCAFEWGERKIFGMRQLIVKADGAVAAELTGVGGIMDLGARRLVTDPGGALRELATDPKILGLEQLE
ncbi:acyl-CoA thioesterase [Streptomyces spirodelae]|uniref:Acyl-CoA thioesterase n=1 Tax=Streptomyces spirodelae TaxID=2812904 RepID=A0ABS3X3L7_9ACTN|nr:acyl-CoA thioesterase [Streptomyces spirodelae]MBO8189971.1 acyl-CoA thioesterase [Streptomyces spirodelae]